MNDSQALHRLEQRLVPVRSIAGARESLTDWSSEWFGGGASPLQEQAFEAGYDAAMNRVRALLAEVQTEALREAQPRPGIDESGLLVFPERPQEVL